MGDRLAGDIQTDTPVIDRLGAITSGRLDPPTARKIQSLLEAAKVLASASTPEEALDLLAHLAVPSYGDFCAVMVPSSDHRLHMVANAHTDPNQDVSCRLLLGAVPVAPGSASPTVEAFRRGQPVIADGLDPSRIRGWFADKRYATFAERVSIGKMMAIPLASRGSIIGVMALGYCKETPGQGKNGLQAARLYAELVTVAAQQLLDAARRGDVAAGLNTAGEQRQPSADAIDSGRHLKVMVIDPSPVVREGIKSIVGKHPNMAICAEARSIADAIEQDAEPDVVVSELALDAERHAEVASRLAEQFPKAKVLVLSRIAEPIYVHLALAAGAQGYLTKDAGQAEVTEAIAALGRGEEYIQPTLGALLARWQEERTGGKTNHLTVLTHREHQVLDLVAHGHTNTESAAILNVSLRTVETHRSHLARKLGVRSRADLVEAAHDLHPDL